VESNDRIYNQFLINQSSITDNIYDFWHSSHFYNIEDSDYDIRRMLLEKDNIDIKYGANAICEYILMKRRGNNMIRMKSAREVDEDKSEVYLNEDTVKQSEREGFTLKYWSDPNMDYPTGSYSIQHMIIDILSKCVKEIGLPLLIVLAGSPSFNDSETVTIIIVFIMIIYFISFIKTIKDGIIDNVNLKRQLIIQVIYNESLFINALIKSTICRKDCRYLDDNIYINELNHKSDSE